MGENVVNFGFIKTQYFIINYFKVWYFKVLINLAIQKDNFSQNLTFLIL